MSTGIEKIVKYTQVFAKTKMEIEENAQEMGWTKMETGKNEKGVYQNWNKKGQKGKTGDEKGLKKER